MPPVPPHIMAAQFLRPEQFAPAIFYVRTWSIPCWLCCLKKRPQRAEAVEVRMLRVHSSRGNCIIKGQRLTKWKRRVAAFSASSRRLDLNGEAKTARKKQSSANMVL
jgi:hypothetical protein